MTVEAVMIPPAEKHRGTAESNLQYPFLYQQKGIQKQLCNRDCLEINNLRVVWWGCEGLENCPVDNYHRATGRQALGSFQRRTSRQALDVPHPSGCA